MARLELKLLGPFQARLSGEPINTFESIKTRALLAYLAAEAEYPQPREALATLLWPDWPQQSVLRNLSYALTNLRKNLGDREAKPPYLLITRDTLQLNAESDIQVDLWEFNRLLNSQPPVIENLKSAADLSRGLFLEGFSLPDSSPFEEWLTANREFYQQQTLKILYSLAKMYAERGEFEQGLVYARRQLELEPWLEEGHQQVMRLLALSEQRSQALAQYEICRKLLKEQLNVEPGAETYRLYQSIRDGMLGKAEAEIGINEGPQAPGISPFKGLQFFDVVDAGLFFGREALTRQLVNQIWEMIAYRGTGDVQGCCCFLAVVGASGSGKSSLVRAGLVASLQKSEALPEDSSMWPVHVITPTAHPLEALALSLTRGSESMTAVSTLIDDLSRDKRSLHLYINRLLTQSDRNGNHPKYLLLVIDQLEELFTLCRSEEESGNFIENLLNASHGPALVVVTLRADFYAHCARYPGLRQALCARQEYIGPMTAAELRRAIEEPARQAGWEFEPGLVDLILRDVGDEPGALPLLEHALLETWQRRSGRTMTLKGYAAAGGVQGAIAHTAESLFNRLTPGQQALARRIFLRLTELGEGTQDTRRRASLSELAPSAAEAPQVESLLKELADARLITLSEDTAEVAHEALIREWPALRAWLSEDRESLLLQRRLTEAAQEWNTLARDSGELYRSARLAQALEWANQPGHASELNPLEREFLRTSQAQAEGEAHERETQLKHELAQARQLTKTQRQRAVVLTVGLAIALLLAGLSSWFYSQGQVYLRLAISRQLAVQAQSLLRAGYTQQIIAVLLAIQSVELSPSLESSQILQENTLARQVASMTHADKVISVAFSPDGKYVASGSVDGTARVWEAITGKEIARMTHDDIVETIAFSPNGRDVVSGSADGTSRVWEAASGKEIARMTHAAPVFSVAFSPDGRYVVSGSYDGTLRVWDAASGREIAHMIHDDIVTSVAFSPDSRYVVSGSRDNTARVWDVATRTEIARTTHDADVNSVVFSPDGRYILSGSTDTTARVWEAASGKVIARMAHNGAVESVAFSPDGSYVVTGSYDHTARVWEAATGKEISRETHADHVWCVAFSPDSRYVVSGSADGTALFWEAASGLEMARVIHMGAVNSVAFSPDGRYVASGSTDKTARVWAFANREGFAHMVHDDIVYSVGFSPDGRYVVSGSADKTARVWEVASGKEIARMTHVDQVNITAFSPDGRFVVSGSADGTARVWDADSGKEITIKNFGSGSVNIPEDSGDYVGPAVISLAISPDGRNLASGDANGLAEVWEAVSGRDIALRFHHGAVNSVAFSPDGRFVASGSDDHFVEVWEVASHKEIAYMIHDSAVNSVSFSPDGRFVVSGSDDGTARVWEASSGKEIARMTHDSIVYAVAFSPDGRRVVSGSYDGTARVWEAASGKEIARMTHDSIVYAVAFSPDGHYVVSGSNDRTARVWEASSGKEITRITHAGAVLSVTFSPDGRHVASGGRENNVRVWLWRSADLVTETCSRLPRNLTRAEWQQYIGDALPYRAVCPNLPLAPDPTPGPTPENP